jgi:hypothetical protein
VQPPRRPLDHHQAQRNPHLPTASRGPLLMLNATDINEIISTLTYRPGWTITATDDTYEGVQIRIHAPVPDAFTRKTITLGITSHLSPNDRESTHTFLAWLAYRLHRIESHEAREMLQRDGRSIFDPHKAENTHLAQR